MVANLISMERTISIGWKARAGGEVVVQVGVMDPVQPPQRGHGVEEHVLHPDHEVEHDHRNEHREPARQVDRVEQPPALRAREERHADRGGGKQEAQQERIQDDQPEVAGPALQAGQGARTSWRAHLPESP
jgi:hypothetical protein